MFLKGQLTVGIESSANLPAAQLQALAALLRELIALADVPDVQYLKKVLVVPDGHIEQTVNQLLQQGTSTSALYVAGPHAAEAVAVPVE